MRCHSPLRFAARPPSNGKTLAHVRDRDSSVCVHLPRLPIIPPPKMRVLAGLLCIVTQAVTVKANVEKTIFLGPSPVTLPNVRPSLEDLHLHVLSHTQTILPTQLPVLFPSTAAPRGLESWYLLQLEAGRRYEVRICWPATVSPSSTCDYITIINIS